MRLAIFSDVHGNPYACEAVLKDIAARGKFDAVIAAGDICLAGSHPAECASMLSETGVLAVYGNTEEYLKFPQRVPPDELHRKMWEELIPVIHWTDSRLTPEQSSWLLNLPFNLRFSPTSRPQDDLVVVHANPKNCELMLYPSYDKQTSLYGEIQQWDDDPEVRNVFSGFDAGTLVHGHLHTLGVRKWYNKITAVNVAPVSMPAIDHDRRARYSIFTWTDETWQIERCAVDYDVEKELSALRNCGMPGYQRFERAFL